MAHNPELDLDDVRRSLRTIKERGFDRDQDLETKLAEHVYEATGVRPGRVDETGEAR